MNQLRVFFRNVSYSMLANIINFVVATVTSLLIPVILGDRIDAYGYFQVYMFYIGYIGFFHFGLCDGVLLEEGGKEYSELDRQDYAFQFRILSASEFLISTAIIVITAFQSQGPDYVFISVAFGLNLIVFLPRNLLEYLLQSTCRIKENACITIIGRTVYMFCILILWAINYTDYYLFVIADIFGKLCALLYGVYQCRDIVFSKPCSWRIGLLSAWKKIAAGIKLMLASISGMIITGVVRFAIQQQWDIATYGKISLILSITNLILLFINAMAIVLYPTLRRVSQDKAISLYYSVRDVLMLLLLGTLLLCYPLQLVMMKLLPQYRESLVFLPILLPVCVYSAKLTLLIQTYMQVFRMEKELLRVNLLSVAISVLLTMIAAYWLHNLTLSILIILISTATRSTLAEYALSEKKNLRVWKNSMVESSFVFFFVGISVFCGMKYGLLAYMPLYLVYLFKKANTLKAAIKQMRSEP